MAFGKWRDFTLQWRGASPEQHGLLGSNDGDASIKKQPEAARQSAMAKTSACESGLNGKGAITGKNVSLGTDAGTFEGSE